MTARRLEITSHSSELARLRSWLREQLTEHGVPAREQSGLQVAVTELAANAIEHSYHGKAGQPIHITLEPGEDRVVIRVEDFGAPFDPARYRAPDLDSPAESGLGLYLARSLADELRIDLGRGRGTRWTLVKYREQRPAHR